MAGNDVTATFAGDIGPLEKAAAQLRAAMKATQATVAKDLTFTPKIDSSAIKAAGANIQGLLKNFATKAQAGVVSEVTNLAGGRFALIAEMNKYRAGDFAAKVTPPPRDFSASNAYLDQVYSRLPDPAAVNNKRGGASHMSGGFGAFQLGNAAAQVQDIAVQLQSGTSMATVLAQQGSQLASAFGPGGMLVGGIVAVAGAIATMGIKSNQAFDGMISGAADAHKEIQKLLQVGGLREMDTVFSKIVESNATLAKERFHVDGFSQRIGMMFGGLRPEERESEIGKKQMDLLNDRLAAEKRGRELAADQVKLTQLTAQHRTKEAEELQLQIAYKQRLAEIDASDARPEHKANMKAAETASYNAIKQGRLDDKRNDEDTKKREKQLQLTKSISELQKSLNEDRLNGAPDSIGEKIKAMEALQKQRRNDAVWNGASLSQSDIDARKKNGDLEGVEKSLKALKEYEATQREIASLRSQKAVQDAAAPGAEAGRVIEGKKQLGEMQFEARLNTLPLEEQIDAIKARIDQLNREAHEAGPLTQSQEIDLKIQSSQLQGRIGGIQEEARRMKDDAVKEAKDKAKAAQRLRDSRDEFRMQLQIDQAIASGATKQDPKVKAMQDQLAIMRLQRQLQEQLNIDAAKALQLAQAKVAADNATTQKQQQRNAGDIMSQAAINKARAHGHNRKAERLESEAGVESKTREIMERTGVDEAKARAMAKSMQRDEDKIAGRATVIRGGKSSRGKTLEEYKADHSKPTDQLYQPGDYRYRGPRAANNVPLAGVAQSKAKANAAAASGAGKATNLETLFEAALKVLTSMDNKLNIAN